MRITAAAGSKEKKRFYWRDHCVQRGDVELNAVRNPSEDGFSTYTAIYSAEDHSRKDFHRDLLVPLYPSLEGQHLRWSAPSICERSNLTSNELAEVLLAKLVTFDDGELPADDPFLSQ